MSEMLAERYLLPNQRQKAEVSGRQLEVVRRESVLKGGAMPTVVRGKFKKPQWRRLRTYERIAHEQHDCSACPNPIEPGDQYQGEVWLWETRDYGTRNKLEVRKYHLECPEDPEEERRRDELEEEFERSIEEYERDKAEEELPFEQPEVA